MYLSKNEPQGQREDWRGDGAPMQLENMVAHGITAKVRVDRYSPADSTATDSLNP